MIINPINYIVCSILLASFFIFIALHLKKEGGSIYNIITYYLLRMLIGGAYLVLFNNSILFSLKIQASSISDIFSLGMVFFYIFLPHPKVKSTVKV